VASDGNDENAGTAEAPFKTISKAASMATPGTTVIVANGTYQGPVVTSPSGTSNARITYVSASKWGAKIVGSGSKDVAVWRNNGDYVDVQGFDLSGGTSVGIMQTGSHGRLIENRIVGLPDNCIYTYSSDYSLTDNDIVGNVAANCGKTHLDHGIYVGGPGGTISNNISYGNAGFGIHCWHNCNGEVITNNLVFNNHTGGILIGQGDEPNNGDVPADQMIVANNIVVDNAGMGIQEDGATGPNNRYMNNNISGNPDGTTELQTGKESGTITTAPDFVDFRPDGSGDYRLQPSSPDVDAGTPEGAPTWDIVGAPRPQGKAVDIGVFEQ